jgi:hypothetical protein
MEIFSPEESGRAKGLIACIIDGYHGGPVAESLDFLMTDVDDWEALSLELAAHAATVLIVLANLLDVEPYTLFERYTQNGKSRG